MRDDLVSFLVTLLVALLIAFARPSSARCPAGYWLDAGARASGDYECAPLTPEQWEQGPRGGWVDVSPVPATLVLGRVFCAADERAQTTDGVAVFCGAIGDLL